jgi:hypothetical protein
MIYIIDVQGPERVSNTYVKTGHPGMMDRGFTHCMWLCCEMYWRVESFLVGFCVWLKLHMLLSYFILFYLFMYKDSVILPEMFLFVYLIILEHELRLLSFLHVYFFCSHHDDFSITCWHK